MKITYLKFAIFALVLAGAAFIFSCGFGDPGDYGTLVIKIPGSLSSVRSMSRSLEYKVSAASVPQRLSRALSRLNSKVDNFSRAVSPDQDFIDSITYRVDCTGRSGRVSRKFRADDPVALSLPPGNWDVTITVLNRNDRVIGKSDPKTVFIESYQTTDEEIRIRALGLDDWTVIPWNVFNFSGIKQPNGSILDVAMYLQDNHYFNDDPDVMKFFESSSILLFLENVNAGDLNKFITDISSKYGSPTDITHFFGEYVPDLALFYSKKIGIIDHIVFLLYDDNEVFLFVDAEATHGSGSGIVTWPSQNAWSYYSGGPFYIPEPSSPTGISCVIGIIGQEIIAALVELENTTPSAYQKMVDDLSNDYENVFTPDFSYDLPGGDRGDYFYRLSFGDSLRYIGFEFENDPGPGGNKIYILAGSTPDKSDIYDMQEELLEESPL